MVLQRFFFELKFDCFWRLDHELMNWNAKLYLSLELSALTLPGQHLLQLLNLSTSVYLMLDLFDTQLISVSQPILLSAIGKQIRFQIMYIIPLHLNLDLILLLDDSRIAVGVPVDALNGGRGDFCDLV